jgi:hypothetical protein
VTVLATIMLFFGMGHLNGAFAEVNINVGISIPPPPPLRIHVPPPVTVIPRTYVYFAPEVDVDIFFFGGHWYRPHQDHWYRSDTYNGRWTYIAPKQVPVALVHLPPDHRRLPPGHGHKHIPYGDLKKNWKTWEKTKHWDKHGGKEWHGDKWEHERGNGKNGDRDRDKGKDKGKHGD